MIYNIPPICKKPLILVDENGVLSKYAKFLKMNGSYEFVENVPQQKDGYVYFYEYLQNNQIGQTWVYYKPVNISFYKALVFEKGVSSGDCSVRFYKSLPSSFSELELADYVFEPSIVNGRYVINGVLSEIYGNYWVVFHCKNTGEDGEHNYYKFYFS